MMLFLKRATIGLVLAIAFSTLAIVSMAGSASADDPYVKSSTTYWLPEADDEVLIVFEQGDIFNPYVIGSLWNSTDEPPESDSEGK